MDSVQKQAKPILESPFNAERAEELRDEAEARLLKQFYPSLSSWSSDATQNAWDMYARSVLGCSSISPVVHDEFMSFVQYVCQLDQPSQFNPEGVTDIEMLREKHSMK